MHLNFISFQRLQWKLMFSYVLLTPIVLLVIEFLLFVVTLVIIELFFVPSLVLYGLQQYQPQLSPFFAHNGMPDQQALALWLKHPIGNPSGYQPEFRVIVDKDGRVIVSSNDKIISSGILLEPLLPSEAAANLRQVLAGKGDNQGMVSKSSNGAVIAMVPIRGDNSRVDGALIDDTGPNVYMQEAKYWLGYDSAYIFITAGAYTFFAVVIGMISGFFTARTITRRFNTLAVAADNWSQGDFSTFVQDDSRDELGQLSRKLNRMAEQLQNLLQTRQKLAIVEERNRLARDLHDSVKQHIFVIALQVGTAKLLLDNEPDITGAQHRLVEAEHVLQYVQEELKTLIHELRPIALEGRGLRPALQELIEQWERQTGIQASLSIESEQALPVLVEEALFRVAQEALSNVARHSQATSVQVRLVNEADRVTLSIIDNGQGFDATAAERKGIGLFSMQERMQALDGDVKIESQPGKGTRVFAYCAREFSESKKGEGCRPIILE
ncbi:MAG TPA: sensor histidine kinase [Ktedonobacteraceae bacterium]|jgi:NarL family two-component system sensor histidine kinase LiaS|nr:sensor histidine kinase [Ktedonobacteraceae bacterium]